MADGERARLTVSEGTILVLVVVLVSVSVTVVVGPVTVCVLTEVTVLKEVSVKTWKLAQVDRTLRHFSIAET